MADAHEPNLALAWIVLIGYWLCYPLWLLLRGLWFIARQLYRPLAFVLLPLGYLIRFIVACIALPFIGIAKLETIYIFLGVAALVGLCGGLFFRSIYAVLYKLFRLDARPPPRLRTAKQYREEKRRQKSHFEVAISPRAHPSPLMSPNALSLSDGARQSKQRQGLLEQTIVEEDDSEF